MEVFHFEGLSETARAIFWMSCLSCSLLGSSLRASSRSLLALKTRFYLRQALALLTRNRDSKLMSFSLSSFCSLWFDRDMTLFLQLRMILRPLKHVVMISSNCSSLRKQAQRFSKMAKYSIVSEVSIFLRHSLQISSASEILFS